MTFIIIVLKTSIVIKLTICLIRPIVYIMTFMICIKIFMRAKICLTSVNILKIQESMMWQIKNIISEMIKKIKPVPTVEFVELKPKTYSFVKNNSVVKWTLKEMNHERFYDK